MGAARRSGGSCRCLCRCHLLLLLLLLLTLWLQEEAQGALSPTPHHLRHLLSASTAAHPCPASAAAAAAAAPSPLGPYGELLQLERAPLLWQGLESGHQGSAHEREGDFSAWLYAERERLYFFDQHGPLCLARLFYGASGELADDAALRFFERAVLHVEVDGAPALAAPAEALFNGSLAALLPAALTASLPAVFARGGNVLLAPLCAHQRLRLAWQFPLADAAAASRVPGLHVNSSAQALAQADECVAQGSACFLKVYSDASFLRFPAARALPAGWAAFDGAAPPLPAAPALAALGLPPPASPELLSGPHLLARTRVRGAEPALTQRRCSTLRAGGSGSGSGSGSGAPGAREHVIFSAPEGRAGTLLAWTLDFPAPAPPLRALAHSPRLVVVGQWDGGSGPAGGGSLRAPLLSLLGPPALGYGADAVPTLPSQQLALGTATNASTGASSVYFNLPAPFWRSARLALALEGADEEEGGGAALEVEVCSEALATARVPAPAPGAAPGACGEGASAGASASAGYLQGTPYDFFVRKAAENELLRLANVTGKLVLVTNLLEARRGVYTSSVVEGDVRIHVDGSVSPAQWDSGYEDFFSGAHTYQWGVNRTDQPLFAHQRRDTERWMAHASAQCIEAGRGDCGAWRSKLHPDTDLLSTRVLLLDAVPFLHSVALALEGFSGDYEMAQSRGVVLYYGRAAGAAAAPAPARAPAVTDTLHPAVEHFLPPARRRHGYALRLPPPQQRLAPHQRYDLASAHAGRGEPPSAADGACPILSTGHGAAGADYHSCPAALLALPVLALPRGARVAFTLALDPAAARCALLRTLDAAHSVQRAALSLQGAPAGVLASSERAFAHLNTRWREAVTPLPPELTRGRSALAVALEVLGDEEGSGGGGGGGAGPRVYPNAQMGQAWTEARWQVVCYY